MRHSVTVYLPSYVVYCLIAHRAVCITVLFTVKLVNLILLFLFSLLRYLMYFVW